jgi:hypothetical protein
VDSSDGSETKVNGSTSVTVSGTGTTLDPYVLTSIGGDGSETKVNGSATVTVTGTGTTGDPYNFEITPLSINTAQLDNNAVTDIKIQDGAVNSNKITNGTILAEDIANFAIENAKIDVDAVTTDKILNGTILNEDISAGAAIDGFKINPVFNLDISTTGNLQVDGNVNVNGTHSPVPNYVFQKYFLGNSDLKESYDFQTLAEIEAFIKKHHHLPGIKSAEEVKQDGYWNLSESNLQNLEKIEELFLHTIEQEKKIEQLKTENESLSAELLSLRKDMDEIKALLKNKN